MPKLKDVSKLDDLCVENICNNILRHTARYSTWHGETLTEYYFLQRFYADDILIILNENQIKKMDERNFSNDQLIFGNRKRARSVRKPFPMAFGNFVFNPYVTGIPPNKDEPFYVQHSQCFLKIITKNCQGINHLSIRVKDLNTQLSTKAFRSLTNLRSLNLESTNCSDEVLIAIWKNCVQLNDMNLNNTKITDIGLKALCGQNSESEDRMNMICCRPAFFRHLSHLSVRDTRITESGILCALLHLPYLVSFKHGSKSSLLNEFGNMADNVASTIANNFIEHLELRKIHLNDIFLTLAKMRTVLSCMPFLENLSLDINVPSLSLFQHRQMKCLTVLKISTDRPEVFSSVEFGRFLRENGHRLEKLSLNLYVPQLWDVELLLQILRMCPNLITLQLTGCFDNFLLYNEGIEQNLPNMPSIQLPKLRSLTLNGTTLSQVNNFKMLLPLFSLPSFENLMVFNHYEYSSDVFPFSAESAEKFRNVKRLLLFYDPLGMDFLMHLICDTQNRLENLMLIRCPHHDKVTESIMKQYARERNFDVAIIVRECTRHKHHNFHLE